MWRLPIVGSVSVTMVAAWDAPDTVVVQANRRLWFISNDRRTPVRSWLARTLFAHVERQWQEWESFHYDAHAERLARWS